MSDKPWLRQIIYTPPGCSPTPLAHDAMVKAKGRPLTQRRIQRRYDSFDDPDAGLSLVDSYIATVTPLA